MIVPKSNFSCNGRVTGYLISLMSDSNRGQGSCPIVQIWHPTSPTIYTRVVTECALTENDISVMIDNRGENYYLGNVTCTENNRIEFQSGDVIGYRQDTPAHYLVWSITTSGYTSYYDNLNTNRQTASTFNTGINGVTSGSNRQPLIQMIYGKINYVATYS